MHEHVPHLHLRTVADYAGTSGRLRAAWRQLGHPAAARAAVMSAGVGTMWCAYAGLPARAHTSARLLNGGRPGSSQTASSQFLLLVLLPILSWGPPYRPRPPSDSRRQFDDVEASSTRRTRRQGMASQARDLAARRGDGARGPGPDRGQGEGRCQVTASAQGIDVSHYQDRLTAAALKPYSFAFTKATDGPETLDPNFYANWALMKAVGVHEARTTSSGRRRPPRGAGRPFPRCRARRGP